MKRPVIALVGLTACSGCQLTLFNCEKEFIEISKLLDICYFPMGVTERAIAGPFDAAFVEGAVSTPTDLHVLMRLRSESRMFVAFGTCAAWGGIATLKNHEPRERLSRYVCGPLADSIATFPPDRFDKYVSVDYTIVGCPPEKHELMAALAALQQGTRPLLPEYPVCTECRNRENLCLLIERNQMCLGPLIRSGCNARCPAVGIPCEGCRGPALEVNSAAEMELLLEKGFKREEIESRMRRFCPEWNYERTY